MAELGVFGAMYYNTKWYPTEDYYTNPNWVEVNLARDVVVNGSNSEYDITPRNNGGFAAAECILTDVTIEAGILHVRVVDQWYAQLKWMLDAFFEKTPMDLWVAENLETVPSVSGMRFPVVVAGARKSERIDGEQTWELTFRQHVYPDGNIPGLFPP